VILLTSHDTGDIEQICARVILVNHGRVLVDKSLDDLRSAFLREKRVTIVTEEETPEVFGDVTVVERGRHRLTLAVDTSKQSIDRVIGDALARLTVRDLTIENAPHETIIRDLYGESPGAPRFSLPAVTASPRSRTRSGSAGARRGPCPERSSACSCAMP
jgi:ABC-2 type transport system ATP-binding protein